MKAVLLRLEGPLQSWGTRSRFKHRDTELEPSKSGVLGLVAAALGMERDDDEQLHALAAARMGVRVDRQGKVLVDYHTAGAGTFRGEELRVFGSSHPIITHRSYLQDASFVVALAFEDGALAERVAGALESPRWPLFLGRRSCPPALPVHIRLELRDVDLREALTRAPWPGSTLPAEPLRLVLECPPGADAEPREDQPLSFRLHGRHFARRYVRIEWLEPSALAPLDGSAPMVSSLARRDRAHRGGL